MALGLVSLLTVMVGFLMISSLGLTAALFGVAGLVFGIIALVRRQRNRGFALTGIITGAIGSVATVALALFFAMVALSPGFSGEMNGATGSAESSQQVGPTALNFDGEWPTNYADGGITFDQSFMPIVSAPLVSGDSPQTPGTQREGGVADIALFIDYRCPACLFFEEANAQTLTEVVASGQATLQLRTLSFLDRGSQTAYSSRAAGAVACLAKEQPSHAWPAHLTLLSAEVQPAEGSAELDDQGLVVVIERTAGPVNEAARSCIEAGTFVPYTQAFTEWTFQNPVPNAIDPNTIVDSTPSVFVNGVPYTGPIDDAAVFRTFLIEQGITVQ
jgi:hypothetical protein